MSAGTFAPFQTKTVSSALAYISQCIKRVTDTPDLDAKVLLANVMGKDKAWLLAHPEETLTASQNLALAEGLVQLSTGMPMPYVLGKWEFYKLTFRVTPDVLIPRPETELLVETAIEWLRAHPERRQAAEVGIGSGCISVSLAHEVPDVQITATDISPNALTVAGHNIRKHDVEDRVQLHEADLLTDLPGPFDLLCANLPYIPTNQLYKLPVFMHEPTLALDGGKDGLESIGKLLAQAVDRMNPGGLLLFEIESGHPEEAQTLAAEHFPQAHIEVRPDLAGLPRLLVIQLP